MSDTIRHYLVFRTGGEFSGVEVYNDSDEAVKEYGLAEAAGHECVLLGADCLESCIQTHGSWFDSPRPWPPF